MNRITEAVESLIQFKIRTEVTVMANAYPGISPWNLWDFRLFTIRGFDGGVGFGFSDRFSGHETQWAQDREQSPQGPELLGDSMETTGQDSDKMRGGI